MGTVMDITQYELNSSLTNEEVDAKIKLRTSSHANLIRHLKNIPYKAVKGPKIKSSKFHFPIEEMKIKFLPQKNMNSVMKAQRPINVKEDKTENIRRHSDILISMADEKEHIKAAQSDEISIPGTEEIFTSNPVVEETTAVQQEVTQENPQVVTNEDNTTESRKIVNISDYIAKIENESQLVKSIKEKAALEQQEAHISDEDVNKVSVEFSELEKQEADIIKTDNELDQQVMAAYESQTKTLALVRKEYETLIEEAVARKQANENKIVQMQSKMNDIREHITTVNESIARKQAILSAMQQTEYSDNIVQFPDVNDTEEKVKRHVS